MSQPTTPTNPPRPDGARTVPRSAAAHRRAALATQRATELGFLIAGKTPIGHEVVFRVVNAEGTYVVTEEERITPELRTEVKLHGELSAVLGEDCAMPKLEIVDSPRPEEADEDLVKIHLRLAKDERVLHPDVEHKVGEAVAMLAGLLTGTISTIGAARAGRLKSIRRLIRSFEVSGWVPRSKAGTWPAEFDEPTVDRTALVKLHGEITSGLLGEPERQRLHQVAHEPGGREARAVLERDDGERDTVARLAAALDLEG